MKILCFLELFYHVLCQTTNQASARSGAFLCWTYYRKKKPATMKPLIMVGKKDCVIGTGLRTHLFNP